MAAAACSAGRNGEKILVLKSILSFDRSKFRRFVRARRHHVIMMNRRSFDGYNPSFTTREKKDGGDWEQDK